MSTSFTYDILGQLRENSISDIQKPGAPVQTSSITYDLRGLQTRLESPETGITDLAYDDAGSLIRKVTPNLRRVGKAITYTYDPLGRIAGIDYPDMRDVTYTYGAQGAPHNSAGRLVSRRDESGSISYRYGLMGEVTYEERSLERLTPLEPERSAAMRYRSDYLGRMASITYPDGEKISYTYDPGGQVTGIQAARSDGTQTILVKKIGYDEYGQRTYLEYGNGNITTYTYDEQRRWMDTLKTQNTRSGVTLQNLTYRFDAVGNVLSRGEVTSRYSTSQSYSYDALYQLTGATGNYTERPAGIDDWRQEYSQNFSYDALGNITRKISTQSRLPQSSGALSLNYQLDYEYDENKPRQATKIGEMYYGYDPNGNLIEESVIPVGRSRAGQAANITQIGKVRIADRGFGLVNNPEDDASLYRRMFSWDEENRLKKVQDPSNTVQFLYDAEGMRTVKHSREGETLYYNTWWSETEDLPGFRRSKHIYLGSERIVSRLSIEEAGPNYEDLNTYYYHPDHLGSVHSVSDSEGNPYERIEYTPFGEMWIEIREDANTKDLNYIPYRFTSKEWDSETGLYSFPARYFEPKLSRWMSADPAGFEIIDPQENSSLLISAANWYSYSENNPVKYKDPDGKLPTVVVGAITGGLIGAIAGGISAVSQGKTSFRDIAAGAAGGAISGAATGALAGSGIGILAAGSFVGGAAGSVTENIISKGTENLSVGGLAKDAAVDGAISALAAGAAKLAKPAASALKNKFIGKVGSLASRSGRKNNPGLLKRATRMKTAMDTTEKSVSKAKPVLELIGSTVVDLSQDKYPEEIRD